MFLSTVLSIMSIKQWGYDPQLIKSIKRMAILDDFIFLLFILQYKIANVMCKNLNKKIKKNKITFVYGQ